MRSKFFFIYYLSQGGLKFLNVLWVMIGLNHQWLMSKNRTIGRKNGYTSLRNVCSTPCKTFWFQFQSICSGGVCRHIQVLISITDSRTITLGYGQNGE